LVVMSEGRRLGLDDLPAGITVAAEGGVDTGALGFRRGATLPEMLATVECRILTEARERYVSQAQMARALGVNQSTIARKLKKLGL
ncbi:MAG: helix-turn-helix domain-containing protein, partial [Anaerolineae bacterium]